MPKRSRADTPGAGEPGAGSASLEALRAEVARTDAALLELLGRRMELVARIGRAKAARGDPVVVREVEELVLQRARGHAAACGLSEPLLEEIFRALIRASVERQQQEARRRLPRRGRVLVVGAAGGMGRWLGGLLDLGGWDVERADPALAGEGAQGSSYPSLGAVPSLEPYAAVVVAVPLGSTSDVLRELVARRPPGPLLEIASIKAPLAQALEEAESEGVEVLSIHPMFGPSQPSNEPATFVLALRPGRLAQEQEARLTDLLGHPYARIVCVPFEAHDELMAWVLGLAHLAGLLFAASLARSGLAPSLLAATASTTYRREVQGARSILAEDPELYLDIQHLNPHREQVYGAVREALAELERASATRDRPSFRGLVERARAALGAPPPAEA